MIWLWKKNGLRLRLLGKQNRKAPARGQTFLLLAFALSWLSGCGEAPRDNPLDPLSPDYDNRGTLRVRTQTFYPPPQPLASASVLVIPGNFLQTTNAAGEALFANLEARTYQIIATKSGFVADTQQVEVPAQTTLEVAARLNAIPAFTQITVISEHISRWFPANRDHYRMVVTAQVQDADGLLDISSVTLASGRYGELGTLRLLNPGTYEIVVPADSLPDRSLFELIGDPLRLEARDQAGASSLSEAVYLSRIVEATPVASSPAGLAQTGVRPRFKWIGLPAPFQYTFRVDISQFDPTQQFAIPFDSVPNIDSDSSAYSYNKDMPGGDYYWTISIVDRNGNLSRSREAAFTVQ